MPRKSADELKVVALNPTNRSDDRLAPPPHLTGPEREVFVELIATNAPDHFRRSDIFLLVSYCSAVVLNQRAAEELRTAPIVKGKNSPWLNIFEKTGRAMVALSMRLRLSPQARKPNQIKGKSQRLSIYEKMALGQTEEDDDAAG